MFQIEEEALFFEWEEGVDSQQGSSFEDARVTVAQPSDRAGSSVGGAQVLVECTLT